jgi:hypothetical protein
MESGPAMTQRESAVVVERPPAPTPVQVRALRSSRDRPWPGRTAVAPADRLPGARRFRLGCLPWRWTGPAGHQRLSTTYLPRWLPEPGHRQRHGEPTTTASADSQTLSDRRGGPVDSGTQTAGTVPAALSFRAVSLQDPLYELWRNTVPSACARFRFSLRPKAASTIHA